MATTKSKTGAKPRGKASTVKGRSVKRTKKKNKKSNPMMAETVSIATIAVSIFLIFSIFTVDSAGTAGSFAGDVFKGLFGFGAYIFPFVIIVLSIYVLLSGKKKLSLFMLAYGTALFFVVITFVHILFVDRQVQYDSFIQYIANNYEKGGLNNGGLLGASVGNICLQAFGLVGTYIVLFALGLVLIILLTGRSFFEALSEVFYSIREKLSFGDEYDDDEDEDNYEEVDKRVLYTPLSQELHPVKKGRAYTYEINDRDESQEKKKILLVNEELNLKKQWGDSSVSLPHLLSFENDLKKREQRSMMEKRPEPTIKLPLVDRDIDMERRPVQPAKQEPKPLPEEEIYDELCLSDKPPKEVTVFNGQSEKVDIEEYEFAGIVINTEPAYKEETESEDDMPEEETLQALSYEYEFPLPDFLNKSPNGGALTNSRAHILENSKKLEDTLKSFGVEAKVIEVCIGPAVTRYEISPGQGVKVSKISGLSDDLALNLAAAGIRIEAPIPGKAAVGIEVPNIETQMVYLREIIESDSFVKFPSKLAFALGKDIGGNPVVADIAKMPHLLIAGSTGSGKSVCINTLITSIIYKARPEEVKLLLIDPKVVELSVYNGIPHLLIPVVNDPKKAAGALNWAVREMTLRYDLFAQTSVRDLKGYNAYKVEQGEEDLIPQLVIIIDELADLMMTAGKEVEEAICRLAQMARAAGIHLIIATQRPSVDVITGLIKANIPSRIAFAVSSGTDSRTILDSTGAERLLGKGDMLFYPMGMSKPLRVQGGFISDKEVELIVKFIKRDGSQVFDQSMVDKITAPVGKGKEDSSSGDEEEFMESVIQFVVKKEKASASMLQRQFRIGYNRASRIIEMLEERGVVGPEDGSKPRRVLMTRAEWEGYNERRNEL